MGQVTDAIGLVGADGAVLLPRRVEHEVLHDELSPALEQIQQADLAVRTLEDQSFSILPAGVSLRRPAI